MLLSIPFQCHKIKSQSSRGYATKQIKKKKKIVKKLKVVKEEIKEKTLLQKVGLPSDPLEGDYCTYVRAALDKGVVPANEEFFIQFFDKYARRIKQETSAQIYGMMAEYNIIPTIRLFESLSKSCQDMNYMTQLFNHMTRNRIYITPKILNSLRYDSSFFDPFDSDTGSEFGYQLMGYLDKVGAAVPNDTVSFLIRYFKSTKDFGSIDQIFMILCQHNHPYVDSANTINVFISNAMITDDAIQGMTLYAKLRELRLEPTASQIYKFRRLFVNYPEYLDKLEDDEVRYNENQIATGLRPTDIGGRVDSEYENNPYEIDEDDEDVELDEQEKAERAEFLAKRQIYLESKKRAELARQNQSGTRSDRQFAGSRSSRVDRGPEIQATNLD